MICKLCLQEKPLLKKSHIIPEFMHRGLFDDKHALYRINFNDYQRSTKLYTGEYESDILCAECDNVLIGHKYEDYSSVILYGGKLPNDKNIFFQNRITPDGLKLTYAKGIDYKKFKLFLLSILWRSSISSRPFFENINLGPYEEKIRKMILIGDPKDPLDFPCIISTCKNLKDLPDGFIGQPKKCRIDNLLSYAFFIGGFLYIFLISKAKKPAWVSEAVINKKDEIYIIHMEKENAKKMINHFMQIELVK